MPVIDLHQHLWPEGFVGALARRSRPPRLVGSLLELDPEPATEVDLREHELDARLALLDRCGIDVAVISLPPTLGIDALPGEERAELVAVWEEGAREVVAASSGRLVALASGRELEGFVGAIASAAELQDREGSAPRLDELQREGAFLFVHPGPARHPHGAPGWWTAVVDYTAQMQAAYASWLAAGAERWPDLKVVFAFLAGGGPFQLERLQSRGVGGRTLLHDNVFLETASYGRRAIELCLSTFGVGQLCFGTDVPVIDPEPTLDAVRGFGDAVHDALCNVNPSRLLG